MTNIFFPIEIVQPNEDEMTAALNCTLGGNDKLLSYGRHRLKKRTFMWNYFETIYRKITSRQKKLQDACPDFVILCGVMFPKQQVENWNAFRECHSLMDWLLNKVGVMWWEINSNNLSICPNRQSHMKTSSRILRIKGVVRQSKMQMIGRLMVDTMDLLQ